MTKVITYGTYDLLHYGHIRLLERAKELGDYLIVGVTTENFDKSRGKINVQQTLTERIEAVRATGIADEIIVEEYEGQKIDDILRYQVDIFTVGSDWTGKFDYLKEYCDVVYLPRTEGISSTEIRSDNHHLKLGIVGDTLSAEKVIKESKYVDGISIVGACVSKGALLTEPFSMLPVITDDYEELLRESDALYLKALPELHFEMIRRAIQCGKHVLCESPMALSSQERKKLCEMADASNVIVMDGIKTAYCTAYMRLRLMIMSKAIGNVYSVDATCTSLAEPNGSNRKWDSYYEWAPTALLPVFQLLGVDYLEKHTVTHFLDDAHQQDGFTKTDYRFKNAVASIKVGNCVKSEGELVISGTKGYIYVPAPWWKTDYFEVRFEKMEDNKRYFYQLDGEGIRNEIASFVRAIEIGAVGTYISEEVSEQICEEMGDFYQRKEIKFI